MAWNEVFQDTITGITQDSYRNDPAVAFSRNSSINGILNDRSTSTYVAFGGFDGNVHVYNTSDWSKSTFNPDGSSNDIKDLEFYTDDLIAVLKSDTLYLCDGSNSWNAFEQFTTSSDMHNLAVSYTRKDLSIIIGVGGKRWADPQLYFYRHSYTGWSLQNTISEFDSYDNSGIWNMEFEPGIPQRLHVSSEDGRAKVYEMNSSTGDMEEADEYQISSTGYYGSISPRAYHRNTSGDASGYGYHGHGAELDLDYTETPNLSVWEWGKSDWKNDYGVGDWDLNSYQQYNKVRLSNDLNWLAVSDDDTIYIFEPLLGPYRYNRVENNFTINDSILNMNFSCDTNWLGVVSFDDYNNEQVLEVFSVPTPSFTIKAQVNGTTKSLSSYPLINKTSNSRESNQDFVIRTKKRYVFPELVSPGDSNDSGVHVRANGTNKAWAEE